MSVLDLPTVKCRIVDGIGWTTLDRPEQLNAWTRQLGDDLLEAVNGFASDPAVRAIAITGAGRAFSSGADLKDDGLIGSDGSVDVLSELRESFNPAILRVRTVDKPVIAAVNGPAAGIGCSLALACDMVIAARSAYFLLAFVNIGLGLDGGASHSLLARVGHARAFEMAALGDRLPAERALEWGLVNEVVEDDRLEAAVTALGARFAAGPPGSYATIKRTLNASAWADFAERLDLEAVLQQERADSADFREGVAAFSEKRSPTFTGQ